MVTGAFLPVTFMQQPPGLFGRIFAWRGSKKDENADAEARPSTSSGDTCAQARRSASAARPASGSGARPLSSSRPAGPPRSAATPFAAAAKSPASLVGSSSAFPKQQAQRHPSAPPAGALRASSASGSRAKRIRAGAELVSDGSGGYSRQGSSGLGVDGSPSTSGRASPLHRSASRLRSEGERPSSRGGAGGAALSRGNSSKFPLQSAGSFKRAPSKGAVLESLAGVAMRSAEAEALLNDTYGRAVNRVSRSTKDANKLLSDMKSMQVWARARRLFQPRTSASTAACPVGGCLVSCSSGG